MLNFYKQKFTLSISFVFFEYLLGLKYYNL